MPTRVASRLLTLVPHPRVREHGEDGAKPAEDIMKCCGVRFQSGRPRAGVAFSTDHRSSPRPSHQPWDRPPPHPPAVLAA